jgi:phospho-N-acetylmuramoyl-pentapeptide-transferase
VRGILVASACSLILALLGTPMAIRLFARYGLGQPIREDGPETHQTKRGTPTMGGAVIIVATVLAYAIAHVATLAPPTASGLLALFLMCGLGAVGFVDDFIKVYKQRSLGLRSGAKLSGQAVIAFSFAYLALQFPNASGVTPASTNISFLRDTAIQLGPWLFMIWAYLMVAASSNAVNLTDGLDGLATGASVMVLAAYVIIGNWQLRNSCIFNFLAPRCYDVRDPLDLAVFAAAVMGACFGFLWWNAPPARIIMGDTGSLALGGALSGLAITTRTELLLVLLGGLFVVIALSVIIQVGFFKMTHRRVFKMAPLQHHFELSGWNEVTIVIRFWIICGLAVAFGLGVFYAEWVAA